MKQAGPPQFSLSSHYFSGFPTGRQILLSSNKPGSSSVMASSIGGGANNYASSQPVSGPFFFTLNVRCYSFDTMTVDLDNRY